MKANFYFVACPEIRFPACGCRKHPPVEARFPWTKLHPSTGARSRPLSRSQWPGGCGSTGCELSSNRTNDAWVAMEEILAALLVMNRRRCKPPLLESEMRVIAEDVAVRYQPQVEVSAVEELLPPLPRTVNFEKRESNDGPLR